MLHLVYVAIAREEWIPHRPLDQIVSDIRTLSAKILESQYIVYVVFCILYCKVLSEILSELYWNL